MDFYNVKRLFLIWNEFGNEKMSLVYDNSITKIKVFCNEKI